MRSRERVFATCSQRAGRNILVLDGVFQDEHGDFPAGTYVRNPPQSSHTPRSRPGCVIFVKLWQFDPSDRTQIRVDTADAEFEPDPSRPGIETLQLFSDDREAVVLERWQPDRQISLVAPDGIEVLVLDGSFEEGGERFESQSWLRLPNGSETTVLSGPRGARVWIKRGHLAVEPAAPAVG